MTNTLASKYSYHGAKQKIAFKSLKLNEVIIGKPFASRYIKILRHDLLKYTILKKNIFKKYSIILNKDILGI